MCLVVLNGLGTGALLAQRGGAVTRGPLPSSTAIGAGALTAFPSSTALSTGPSLRSPGFSSGGRSYSGGGYAYRGGTRNYGQYGKGYNNNRRNWRQLPNYYVATPYYYPFYDYGGDYSGPPNDAYNDPSQYAPDPATDAMLRQQAALGQQVQRLSAQVNDFMYAQQPPIPMAAQPQTPPSIPLTIVLRDGTQMTVQNYAITGNMLWDFTSTGATRKIPLSNIDVPASTKATEAAGGEFPQLDGGR